MAESSSDVTVDYVTKHCPAYIGGGCPYAKLAEEKKGICIKCPAFSDGCPFKGCTTVGEMQDKMGQMRDQCKDGAAWIEFMKVAIMVSKVKNLELGTDTPSVFKNGCPFAKDGKGKPIVSPEFIEYPYSVTVDDVKNKCPVFANEECPYKELIVEFKGITENCPAFKDGCPFKELKTIGEYVERMAHMRDTINPKGRAAFLKFNQKVIEISKEAEKTSTKPWPFPANSCPFANDAWGKPIVPKYNEDSDN